MREIGIVQFSEGTYIGEIADGKADGYGRMTYSNGDVYLGEWRNNCQTGIGAKSTSKEHTMGNFVNGLRHGHCLNATKVNYIGYHELKDYYVGNYVNDKRCGQGFIVYDKCYDMYLGNFQNALPNGRGFWASCLNLSNGSFVEGNFVNGKLTGAYTSYAKTYCPNNYIFYGECYPHLNFHCTGYGASLKDQAYATVEMGLHNQMQGDRISYNFKGARVCNFDGKGKRVRCEWKIY